MVNKCVDILVGLQFGSEGKGAVVSRIAHEYAGSVRVGAPNAGHSIEYHGKIYKMRTIPCAWINPTCKLFIGAGGMVDVDLLHKELSEIPADARERLMVDINATILTHEDANNERDAKMYETIGSTTEGVGLAQARKVRRQHGQSFIALNVRDLTEFLGSVSTKLNDMVDSNEAILIEGTQGYGLSLNHGYYPFVTSRDVLAASMLSDCGLAPATVRNVIGVMRTYPIRVHGNSGPMGAEELTWAQVTEESGYGRTGEKLEEKTTVTQRIRRVSRINWDMLQMAVRANRCTGLAVTFLDYIDSQDRGKRSWNALTAKSREFIRETERRLQTPVIYAGTGPNVADMIDLSGVNRE